MIRPDPRRSLAIMTIALALAPPGLTPLAAQASAPAPRQATTSPASRSSERPPSGATPAATRGGRRTRTPDFAEMARQQDDTDRTWQAASDGYMRMDEDPLPQPGRQSADSRVRLHAAAHRCREIASGAGLGAREHPRPSVRALHPVHPPGDGQGIHGHRAGVSRQHRLRPSAVRRHRLRRRRSRRRGDGGERAGDSRAGGRSEAHRHHRLEPRRNDRAAVGLPESERRSRRRWRLCR